MQGLVFGGTVIELTFLVSPPCFLFTNIVMIVIITKLLCTAGHFPWMTNNNQIEKQEIRRVRAPVVPHSAPRLFVCAAAEEHEA